ncbi:MAG TPA: hypothetical protein VGD80_42865 [Kofleriaceae bacterium]
MARRVSGDHLPAAMSSRSRIQQIINHERSISRSLAPFGLALVVATLSLVVLALQT